MDYLDLKTFIHNYKDNTDPNAVFNEQLIHMLQGQRANVNSKLEDFSYRIQDVKATTLLKSEMYSMQQKMSEDIHQILDKLAILSIRMIRLRKDEHIKLNKDYQVKFQNATERGEVIDGMQPISEINQQISALTNHTIFLKETVKRMESMHFAINSTVEMTKMFGSNPHY